MTTPIRKFSESITIPCYCTDSSWRLKVSSFMDYTQEAANRHASLIGFVYDDLIASRTAWVLSRMHIKFLKTPLWRDQVTLNTWHKGAERLFYIRDFIMNDAEGNPAVIATSSWLVLNLDTRRLVRDPGLVDEDTICKEDAIGTPCDKVQIPKDLQMEKVHEHTVSYSDVDMNGHTNNVMYVVWSMNTVDYELVSNNPVKELKINFNHETRPGEVVSLFTASQKDETGIHWFVEGKVGETSAFCLELLF